MKNIFFTSLIIFFILLSCTSNENLKSKDISEIALPDSNEFYKLSNIDTLSLDRRLFFINKFITFVNEDYLIIKGLRQKTYLLGKQREYDSCIIYSKKLMDKAIQIRDSFNIGRALIKLGYYNRQKDSIKKSFKYYNDAFKNFKSINDSVYVAKSLLQMSKIQKDLGDFTLSKTMAIDGITYMENKKDTITYVGLLYNISTAFREEGNLKNALKYNNIALRLTKRIIEVSS